MKIFTIKPDGFKEIKKQILLRSIPIMLIGVGVGIIISFINSRDKFDFSVLLIMVPLMGAAVGYGLYKGINRQKKLYDSYTLTISNNTIIREQTDTLAISIFFNDIIEIIKEPNGSFIVKGKTPTDIIIIPSQIDKYEELEKALQEIRPVLLKQKVSFVEKYQRLAGLFSAALMLCVYTVNNKIIVALSGTALIALMIWSFIKIRYNKNIDNKTKRTSWVVLVVLASVMLVMVSKLMRGVSHLK